MLPSRKQNRQAPAPPRRARYLTQLLSDAEHALLIPVLQDGHLQGLLLLVPRVPHCVGDHTTNLRVKVLTRTRDRAL